MPEALSASARPSRTSALVAEQAALRVRGRAGRVHQHRLLPEAHCAAGGLRVVRTDGVGCSHERGPIDEAVRRAAAEEDQRAECFRRVGRRLAHQRDEVRVLGDEVGRHERDETRVAEHVAELVRLEPRVDEHRGDPGERAAEDRLREVEAAGHEDPDPLARPDPQSEERRGGPLGRAEQRRVGVTLGRQHDRVGVGPAGGPAHDQIPDRGQLDPVGRSAGRRGGADRLRTRHGSNARASTSERSTGRLVYSCHSRSRRPTARSITVYAPAPPNTVLPYVRQSTT